MEAYGAVHNKEVKENLDNGRDSISEMNLSKLTDSDLCEAVEEVLEVWFAEGHTVPECEAIAESILPSSEMPGRQAKIDRLQEAFASVLGRVKEKSARTAVESFALYRKGKQVKESWSNKFSHENGNERLHERLVAADFAKVKNGLLELYKGKHGQSETEYMDSRSDAGKQISGDSKQSGAAYSHRSFRGQGKPAKPGQRQTAQGRMTQADRDELAIRKANLKKEDFAGEPEIEEGYKRLPASKMAIQISSKARKQGMEIGQGKQSSIKPNQQIGKMAGVMDTHNPTRSQAKEKANKAPGFSKRSKSVGEEFEGNYEGPLYAPHPDLEEGYKEIDKKRENAMYRRAGNLARKSLVSRGREKEEAQDKSAKIVSAISSQKERERFSRMADEKARDNYREELEVSQIRKDWAEAYKGIYEAAKPDYLDFDRDGDEEESMKKALKDKEGKCKKCGKEPCECPKEDVKEAKEKWIGSAIKKPGALHKQLGVPEGEPIPEAKLRAAAKQGGKLGQRARLALTLKGLNKEETDWEFLDNLIESEKFTEQQIQKIAEDL